MNLFAIIMEVKFKIFVSILFVLCVDFVQIKANHYSLNQNQISDGLNNNIIKLIENENNLKNYKFHAIHKRNADSTTHIEELNELIDKQIIPEDVEMVNPDNAESTETYDVHDKTCNICAKKSVISIPLVIHKTMVGVIEKTETSYECCPGWKNVSINNCCTEPICTKECVNGQICVGPDTCECPKGNNCKGQNDITNICDQLKPCDHLCVNTDTSFLCICRPGFTLASDKVSCISKETEIQDSVETRDIEKEFEITNAHRLNNLEKKIENNKKATNDLNAKIREIFHTTDILSAKIKNLETNAIKMEKRVQSNEENIKILLKFVDSLWKNSKDLFKKDSTDRSDEDIFFDVNSEKSSDTI